MSVQPSNIKTGVFEKKASHYLIFITLASLMSYYYVSLEWTYSRIYMSGNLISIMEGTADQPWQYRILIPKLVGFIYKNIHLPLLDSAYKVFFAVETLSLILLVIVFGYYLALTLKNTLHGFVLSFTLFLVLPFNFLFPRYDILSVNYMLPNLLYFPDCFSLYYPYDTPSLLFFTVGLILLYKRRWTPYYLLFAITTLNRETTCFLTFVYLFTAYGKDGKKTVALHCTAQFLIWIAIKYALLQIYANNPGVIQQSGIFLNLEILSNPANYIHIMSTMGFVWLPAILFYRLIGDDFVRRSLLVAIPFAVAIFLGAQFAELRDYCELIPVFLAAFIHIFREIVRKSG
jgi:hypothetical protein